MQKEEGLASGIFQVKVFWVVMTEDGGSKFPQNGILPQHYMVLETRRP
jgi:hypothetical protein